MTQRFPCYMLVVGIGMNRKLRRLPVVQRWAYVAGVLSLAAQSPLRGALLISDGEAVTDEDVAEEATVPVKDARAAMAALRRLGFIERDEHGVEWVHDWDKLNPDPKPSDSPEETRRRKREQRARELASRGGHADVTRDIGVTEGDCHAPEGKEEKEGTKDSPSPRDDARAEARAGEGGAPPPDDDLGVWAADIAGVLQRGIDGLTTTERVKPAKATEVLRVLEEHQPTFAVAWAAAVDTREIVQAQDRAPNIVGLYRQKLGQALAVEVAA